MRREAIGKPCGGSMFKGSKFNVSKQKPVPILWIAISTSCGEVKY
jgi:hypothetical protein